MTTISQADIAKALGVTPGQVTRDKARGMPVHLGVEACKAWRQANVRGRVPVGGRQATSQMGEGAYSARPERPEEYHVSRARREAAEAAKAELELAELRGDLVRAAEVRSERARENAMFREVMLQLPARLVPLIVADPSPQGVTAALQREIAEALRTLSEAE